MSHKQDAHYEAKAQAMMDPHQKRQSEQYAAHYKKTTPFDRAVETVIADTLDTSLKMGEQALKDITIVGGLAVSALEGMGNTVTSAMTRGFGWAADSILGWLGFGTKKPVHA